MTDFAKEKGHKIPENGGNECIQILKTYSQVKGKDFYPKWNGEGEKPPKEFVVIGNTKDPQAMYKQILLVLGSAIPYNVKVEIAAMNHSKDDFVIVTLPTSANDKTATIWVFYQGDGCHRQRGAVGQSAKNLNIACKNNKTE